MGIVWTIVSLIRRKLSWWILPTGAALSGLVWILAVGLMQAGIGR